MKIGDLVRERPEVARRKPHTTWEYRCGIIVDIDPLRRVQGKAHGIDSPWWAGEECVEIVVLLPDSTLYHAAPSHWELISEGG